jgi:hypothetical protein
MPSLFSPVRRVNVTVLATPAFCAGCGVFVNLIAAAESLGWRMTRRVNPVFECVW